MTTTDYPHRIPRGNRVGLHYDQFRRRLVSGTTSFARKFRKPGLNPRSWANLNIVAEHDDHLRAAERIGSPASVSKKFRQIRPAPAVGGEPPGLLLRSPRSVEP